MSNHATTDNSTQEPEAGISIMAAYIALRGLN